MTDPDTITDAAIRLAAERRAVAAEAEVARLKQRVLDDTEEIQDMDRDHTDTIKAHLELERQLSARAEAAEAEVARLRAAIPAAFAYGVYVQQGSREKLEPAKVFPISPAAELLNSAQGGE